MNLPHACLVKHTNTNQSSDDGVALKETLRVLLVELQELTSSTTDLGENQCDSPDLSLGSEAVLSGELELRVETARLEWSSRDLVSLGLLARCSRPVRWDERQVMS